MENKKSDKIKIIDLGLSEMIDKKSSLKSERGSIYYLAPEMIMKNYNYKVDIWAAGIIFYVLLTGKPPFNAVHRDSMGTRHLDMEKIKSLILMGKVNYDFPVFQGSGESLKELVQIMLTRNPNKRPEAAQLLKHSFFQKNLDVKVSNEGNLSF
jgi:calcium-dependent protein kinase